MKHLFNSTLALATIVTMLVGCTSKPTTTVEEVLRKSYQKCQSIQQGHYVMEVRKKYMSDSDTTLNRYTCDFKKLPYDLIFGKAFHYYDEDLLGDWRYHFLYTGEEYVYYEDTTGTIMSCD